MREPVQDIVSRIEGQIIADRRDFHRHAEVGWTEFRTASRVARRLSSLGYEVLAGREVLRDEDRMGLPPAEVLERCYRRAIDQGGDEAFLPLLQGGFTGVVGVLRHGDGPTVGLRFDMDALPLLESRSEGHRPVREGFASINDATHACGHDGHTAIGLGLAEVLAALKEQLRGTVKLIFQPAEEGVRGAKAMVSAGVVDDVDYLLGHHLRSGSATGEIETGMAGYAATEKFDVIFTGAPAHAGASPHRGRNALLAAATAVLNLYAIPRHGEGATRINVGQLEAGTGRNIICPSAHLVAEVRGADNALCEYMHMQAMRIVRAAAAMHGCEVVVRAMGSAPTAQSDPKMAARVAQAAKRLGGYTPVPARQGLGSEDFSYMMQRVQAHGGVATQVGIGADLHGISAGAKEGREASLAAHTPEFDIDEGALAVATKLLAQVTLDILS